MNEIGLLYVCDQQGNNAEPICVTDTPTTLDEFIAGLNANDGEGISYRVANASDNLDARVNAVATKADGEICGYYKWMPAHYEITLTSGREATASSFKDALAILRSAIPTGYDHVGIAVTSGEDTDESIYNSASKTGTGTREWDVGLVWEGKLETWQHLAYVEERVD